MQPDRPPRPEEWGYRPADGATVATFDLMTYCEPQWMSDYNFQRILEEMQRLGFWPAGQGEPAIEAALIERDMALADVRRLRALAPGARPHAAQHGRGLDAAEEVGVEPGCRQFEGDVRGIGPQRACVDPISPSFTAR